MQNLRCGFRSHRQGCETPNTARSAACVTLGKKLPANYNSDDANDNCSDDADDDANVCISDFAGDDAGEDTNDDTCGAHEGHQR